VPDHRRRTLLPERLLLPPAPREPDLARRWEALPFEARRRIALAAIDPGARAAHGEEAALVGALAHARVATGWRLQLAALVLGWLVLMTVWGFGRSTFPADEDRWLIGGLAAGAVAWAVAAIGARRRVRRAANVAERLRAD
jgi:hypothetical protein